MLRFKLTVTEAAVMSTNDEHTSWRNWFGTIVVVASGLILAVLISEAGLLFTQYYNK